MSKNIFPKKLVCIFAHPDDESFGCGGAISHFASIGTDVSEICVTSGDFPRDRKKGKIREEELKKSAKILGVGNLYFLRFHDGELSNNNYHEIARKIKLILDEVRPDSILTFNQNGVSGHIDHIVVSMVASYLFEKLNYIKKIYYYSENKEVKEKIGKSYFVYFPDGYSKDEVDWFLKLDEALFRNKIKAMKTHKSQIKDYMMIKTLFGKYLKEEMFLIKTKK